MQATNTCHSTQILAQNIKLNNELKPHIPAKEILAQRFKNQRIYAVSVDLITLKQLFSKILPFMMVFVSRHINYNAENFRSRFVNHEGKKDIVVLGSDILYEISHNTLEVELYYWMQLKPILCGIPKVTLECTLEDWINIQEKIRKLTLELDFWLDRLDPVILNLVAICRGEIEDFLSKIMNINISYGSGGDLHSTVTGWVLGFFSYNREGTAIRKNGLGLDNFPHGTVGVPFVTDCGHYLKFISGFFGANKEMFDGEAIVSPVIGWSIINNDPNTEENYWVVHNERIKIPCFKMPTSSIHII
ncbi:10182_t:CDS:2 [Cetraspora pellucida]|uniref:10182_t:CDS:1 n=1 Tax=Cetraspora pellucida TaxID=1433469 RepID=A0ACA9K7A6_9GLOM|nr:10182_t:CDS:2 [Cetraspora pellucida]